MRIALVYNPATSGGRLARIAALSRVLERRGHALSRHDSLAFAAARDAADADIVCVCGGDGTVRLVVEAQADRAGMPPLAIYPCGTINLLARELGYPRDPERFAERIEHGAQGSRSALAMVGERPFLACASIGNDARTVAGLSEPLKARIGRLAYLVALAGQLRQWPRQRLEVRAGSDCFEAEALFVLRGAYYAGPWRLDRRAGLASDRLHFIALPRARRRDIAALALYALGGARRPQAGWRLSAAREIDVAGGAGCPVQADGDVVAVAPVRFRMTGEFLQWA